ncbi:MAG TPA: arylamine N-acetyltransferase [Herpetosiphonaceae bacterium]
MYSQTGHDPKQPGVAPPALSPQLAEAVLGYLGVARDTPDLALLNALIAAYVRRVPWESASRIAKRARTASAAEAARWPNEFWQDAIRLGTGGTCFESNLAFFALLRSLGYHGYLTINNMHETIGCHTALVIQSQDQRWLVDAGYPIHAALPLNATPVSQQDTPLGTYILSAQAPGHYVVQQTPLPKPYLFDLIDVPVDETAYCAATINDYTETGLFLDRLVIRKLIDGQIWRFNSDEQPYHLQTFVDGERIDDPISGDVPAALSAHFGIDPGVLAAAFDRLSR